jgi:hypothetical protein
MATVVCSLYSFWAEGIHQIFFIWWVRWVPFIILKHGAVIHVYPKYADNRLIVGILLCQSCFSIFLSFFSFFLQYWGLNSWLSIWAPPPALCLWRVFRGRVSQTICQGWLWNVIHLISASWVARIIGVSHWCLASIFLSFCPFRETCSFLTSHSRSQI